MSDSFAQGTVHQAGDDLRAALEADDALLALWQGLTPLGRNEFICWVEDAKKPATRQRRIVRTSEEHARRQAPAVLLVGLHPSPRQGAGPMAASSVTGQTPLKAWRCRD